MYKIIADSSCELRSIKTIPITIYNANVTYIDDENMDITGMLDTFAEYKGRTYTACPGCDAWLNAFDGSDEIYVITITSGLSGTYNSAEAAKEMYLAEHPEAKIQVFDSLSTGPGIVLLVEKIQELKEKGCSFEEVVRYMEDYRKRFRLFFALKSLHNLAQNGRVNKILASAVGALGISIIATASKTGTIDSCGKSRGDKKSIRELISEMEKSGYKGGKVRICHVENKSLADQFLQAFKAAYPKADITSSPASGLVSYYAERGAILAACEIDGQYLD